MRQMNGDNTIDSITYDLNFSSPSRATGTVTADGVQIAFDNEFVTPD